MYRVSGIFEFGKPIFVIRDPKLVKKMTIKDFDHFPDHRMFIDETVDGRMFASLTSTFISSRRKVNAS